MRVYISADIEGVSGVVDAASQTGEEGRDYERARRLMTGEVNAAVEGALAGGATEVVVNDSHGSQRNILIEELHPETKLITGAPKPLAMMEGIARDFDAAFFVGYHSRAGTRGVLNHTISGRVGDVFINGRVHGECGINAAVAGAFGVPVVLVTGDTAVAAEAEAILPGVRTVAVKEHRTRVAARCLQPDKVRRLIREGAEEALRTNLRSGKAKPLVVASPTTVEIRFMNTGMADMAELIPGVKRLDDTRLAYTNDDLVVAIKTLRAMIFLAGCI